MALIFQRLLSVHYGSHVRLWAKMQEYDRASARRSWGFGPSHGLWCSLRGIAKAPSLKRRWQKTKIAKREAGRLGPPGLKGPLAG
jgi:hypothetical protein